MDSWSDFIPAAARIVIALWIAAATVLLLLRSRRRRARRGALPPAPSREGPARLAALIEASLTSASSRDRVVERLKGLARDIAAIQRSPGGGAATRPSAEELGLSEEIRDYLDSDWLLSGGRRGIGRRASPRSDFLEKTERALRELEDSRHAKREDSHEKRT